MKKVFLFAALAAIAFTLSGCNKSDPGPSDPFTWIYTVENDTDSEIVVSYNPYYYGSYGYGPEIITINIAAGESKPVIGYTLYGDYNNPMPSADIFASDDVIPFEGKKLDDIDDETWEDQLKTKFTVGDEEISHEVWLREYWSFEEKDDYVFSYTLTVDDELVEELAIEESDPNLPQQ